MQGLKSWYVNVSWGQQKVKKASLLHYGIDMVEISGLIALTLSPASILFCHSFFFFNFHYSFVQILLAECESIVLQQKNTKLSLDVIDIKKKMEIKYQTLSQ